VKDGYEPSGGAGHARPPARLWAWLRPAAYVAVTGAALLAAACGGSTPGGAPPAGGPAAGRSALAYAQCMRSHGEPGFPDPSGNGTFANLGPVNVHSARYLSASKTCGHLLPSYQVSAAQRKQDLTRALEFAACVRSHGVPSYRDPVELANGNIELGGNAGPGSSPRLRAAAQACHKYLPDRP
jgi:hypothetical protein